MLPEDTFTFARPTAERPTPQVPPQTGDESSKRFAFWSLLVALMLATWCVVLVVSAVLPLFQNHGNSLPVAQSSPKLNNGDVELPGLPEPARPEPRPPEVETVMVPALPMPLFHEPPLLPEAPKIELPAFPALPEPTRIEVPVPLPETVLSSFSEPPLLPVEVRIEEPDIIDLAYLIAPTRAQLLGETPMTRTWKLLSASTIITTALVLPAPVAAQDDLKAVLDKLEKMEKSIQSTFSKVAKDVTEIKTDITTLQGDSVSQRVEFGKTNNRVEKLEIALSKLQADIDAIRKKLETPALYPPSDQFGELKKQLTSIEHAIKGMGETHVSKSGPSMGRLMLVNNYAEDLLFIVNNRNIRVLPGMAMPLDGVPAGSLTYEIFSPTYGPRGRITTMLNPNETLTLTAR